MSSSSELAQPFAERPQPISEFFEDTVQRLLHDNLDYVVSDTWESANVEALHVIDKRPIPGAHLQFHYVYELFDTKDEVSRNQTRKLGLVIANVMLEPPAPLTSRLQTTRHYFASDQGSGFIARHDTAPGQRFVHMLDGDVEDPRELDDPLDARETHTLKQDIARVRAGIPVKPFSNFIDPIIL